MKNEPQLTSATSDLLEQLVRLATVSIEESGKLDPFALVKANQKLSVVKVFQALEQVKGFPANRLVRMVRETIRARPPEPVTLAGIIYGAELTPVEGGDTSTALIVWLEEFQGPAFQVVLSLKVQIGKVVVEERQIIPKRPILFVDNAVTGLDIAGGRVGQMNIRPTTDLLLDLKPTLDEVAQVFMLGALDSESKEDDWKTVAGAGIDKQRFLLERVALRSTAILVALVDASPDDRVAVEDGFWNEMAKVIHNLPAVVHEYHQAFKSSDPAEDTMRRELYVVFSKRCSNGAEHDELIAYARRTFLLTLTVFQKFLKSHGWFEI